MPSPAHGITFSPALLGMWIEVQRCCVYWVWDGNVAAAGAAVAPAGAAVYVLLVGSKTWFDV